MCVCVSRCVSVQECMNACVCEWVRDGLGVSLCPCSLTYPACNAYGPYCHLRPHWLRQTFRPYLIKVRILGAEKVTEHETCVSIFSTSFVWDFSQCRENSARYCHKCKRLHVKYPLFLTDLKETCIFRTDFVQKSDIPSFINVFLVGVKFSMRTKSRKERHDETNSRFSNFFERAEKLI